MFQNIADWISQNITEPLQEMIINSVNAVLVTFLNNIVDMVTSVLGQEVELIEQLLSNTYIEQAVTYSIAMAVILVAVRIGFDGFRTYIAYSTGQENHPSELLKNAATATIMIVSTPWIAKQALTFSLSIVDDIMGIQAVPAVTDIGQAISTLVFTAVTGSSINLGFLVLMVIGIILWIIVLIQIAVRAVHIATLMIIGPWMWAFKNELGGTWFKSLLSQCFAIPIQMFLLRGAIGSLASIPVATLISPLLFIGFLWTAIKFPAFLQQLVAQTGVGGAIGGIAHHAGTAVFIRRMAIRR